MATTREVGAPKYRTTFATPSDREIVVTRDFDAPRKLVFEAHTDPRHLRNWLLGPDGWTMTVCEVDLQPGGAWRFAWRHANGAEMAMGGEYREVVRYERVVNTESWGADYPETLNTLLLAEKDGRTTITSTVLYPSTEARDAALHSGMKDGMSLSFDRLAAYLAAQG